MSRQEPIPFLSYGAVSDPHDMRRGNRNRILRSIITRGPATRAELARRTGMSRPTVSVIANELLTSGVLVEGERVSSGGAPGTLLEMAKDTGVTLVFDIRRLREGTLAAVTATGEVLTRRPLDVTGTPELIEAIRGFTDGLERRSLIGAALTVDGFVDQLGVWQHDDALDNGVVDALRRGLRMPVFAVNATDAMAIADLRDSPLGLAAQATVVAQPVALGLVVEGRLLNGQNRPAGEITHLVPGMVGPTCPVCRRPCLTALVGQLYRDDSPSARELAATSLATALAPIVAAVELEEIVLALLPPDSAADIQRRLVAELRARLPESQMPQVRLSRLGADAVLAGAAAMMVYSRLG